MKGTGFGLNYCYELYHQMRSKLPDDFTYYLSGEVNKVGHPKIAPYCGNIIPDFLVHNPGHMGPDDNLVIVEVKTMEGALPLYEGYGLLKDMKTINCMTSIENGYHRGILLIVGAGDNDKREKIVAAYKERCNPEKVFLFFHQSVGEAATKVELT